MTTAASRGQKWTAIATSAITMRMLNACSFATRSSLITCMDDSLPSKRRTPVIRTVFLDAGGVLVCPNWTRVSDALARHGVQVSAEALAAADPHARRTLDQSGTITATNDAGR